MKNPRIDRGEILRATGLFLVPGSVTELRALDARLAGDRRTGTVSGYFDSPDMLANAVARIEHAKGIYAIPNPINPDLLARAANRVRHVGRGDPLTADHDVTGRRWLLIDLDPLRPTGIASNATEHDAARRRAESILASLRVRGWPDPVVADSGNGWHLMYRIDLPVDEAGLVQRVLAGLAGEFDDNVVKVDTSVFNPARIWKLYGTLACKGDHTADRPHRMSRIIDIPNHLEVVEKATLAAMAAATTTTMVAITPRPPTSTNASFNLEHWIQRHVPDAEGPRDWGLGGVKWSLPICPFNADHVGGSAFIGRLPNGAILKECGGAQHRWNCDGVV
jgi:hypothetical protein